MCNTCVFYSGRMHSRDVIKELKKDGWYEVNQVGSHKQVKHATKKGEGHGAASEPGHTDRHFEKHRETSGDRTEVTPGAEGANSWNISPIFIRPAILITA